MHPINCHIANASGQLSPLEGLINSSFGRTAPIIIRDLKPEAIDVIFLAAPDQTIPELGIGGFSPGPNHIYVHLDPKSDKITNDEIAATLLHEAHHCVRWTPEAFNQPLGGQMVSEGLACLYEAQTLGREPIYAQTTLKKDQVDKARASLDRPDFDWGEWFFGQGQFDRWFGYSLGYHICRKYSGSTGRSAAELVRIPAVEILSGWRAAKT